MQELQKLIHSIVQMGHEPDRLPPSKVDLLLYAPCPIKLAVKDQVDLIAREMQGRGEDVSIHIPMGCTSIDPYDPLYQETDPDRLPAIIASIGFGDFWRKEFVEQFVRPGVFETVLPPRINPMIERAGMIDPRRLLYHLRRHPLYLSGGFQPAGVPSRPPHLGRSAPSAIPDGNRLVRRRR